MGVDPAELWFFRKLGTDSSHNKAGNGTIGHRSGPSAPVDDRNFVLMRASFHLVLHLAALLFALPVWSTAGLVVETKVFHDPGRGPRVEVNMAVMAGTMEVLENERGFRYSRIEAVTIVEQNGVIKAFSKVELAGQERTDTLSVDLVHQEIFHLPSGMYDLYVEVRDLNSTDTTATRYQAPLAVGSLGEGVQISDILLAERFDPAEGAPGGKYGYIAVPLISDYYPSSITNLSFYLEVYGTDRYFGLDSMYLLSYQLENFENRAVHGSFRRVQRVRAKVVEPVIAEFDIADLPSGNYLLAVEVRDRKGDLVGRREQFIQRNNPKQFSYDLQSMEKVDISGSFVGAFTNVDSLVEHIRSLRPIADPLERKIIDDRWKDRDMDLMKRFFYSFWVNRSPDPDLAWKEYREQVVKVNKLFSCRVLKGYETDRGYVYLKFGAPNSMMDRFNEMDAYPYSIWHYYRAGKYTNRRFVFYQASLANNCLELLHSEVPGEVANPRWNQIIHSRNVPMQNVDPRRVNSASGERTEEFYELPR